jgi:hypothetical protein
MKVKLKHNQQSSTHSQQLDPAKGKSRDMFGKIGQRIGTKPVKTLFRIDDIEINLHTHII